MDVRGEWIQFEPWELAALVQIIRDFDVDSIDFEEIDALRDLQEQLQDHLELLEHNMGMSH